MRVKHSSIGVVRIEANEASAPFLRALKELNPGLRIEARGDNNKRLYLVRLSDLNFDHQMLSELNITHMQRAS